MKTRVLMLILCAGRAAHTRAADSPRPQGYRHVDLQKPCQRTYGAYWWTTDKGDICEE